MSNISSLIEFFLKNSPCPFRLNSSWKEESSLGVGGTIPIIAEPQDDIELRKVLLLCKELNIDIFVIGAGTNIVGTDEPYNKLIIKLHGKYFSEIKFGREHVTVGAGVKLLSLAQAAAEHGLGAGLEPLAGIPATIGGAIKMNAGADGSSIGTFIEEICGLDKNANPWKMAKNEISFSYRNSNISDDKIILAAILKLYPEKPEVSFQKINQCLQKRNSIKFEGRNAGCAFKNPGDARAGILLEKANCKLLRINNTFFSEKHANYLINADSATEADVVNLMIEARKRVFNTFGILLTPEFKFVNENSLEKILSSIPPTKVAVLKGGNSSEREVSLKSAFYVANALREAGLTVQEFDIQEPQINQDILKADIVFPVLHGGFGENGEIQKILEDHKLKFVGSKSHSCKITINKIKTKEILLQKKLPTPNFAVITKENLHQAKAIAQKIGFPIVVKAPCEGSTVGVTIVHNPEELIPTIEKTFCYDTEVLLEEFIKGIELTVGILLDKPLPVIEIETPSGFYDYDAKYLHQKGETYYHCPPKNLSDEICKSAQKIALDLYHAVSARHMLRVDFIAQKEDNKLFVLEANSIPGFTESSLLPKAAKQAGISFVELCASLVLNALREK